MDKEIIKVANKIKIDCFVGPEKNVLKGYLAAKKYKFNNICRITADCPIIDANIVDQVIKNFLRNKLIMHLMQFHQAFQMV